MSDATANPIEVSSLIPPFRKRTATPQKKKKRSSKLWSYLFNYLACCLITFSLLGINFVLFASSGPINIFQGINNLRPEILYTLIGMAAVIFAVYFCLSFLSIILYLLTALVTGFFTFAMVSQFANFNTGDGGSGTYGAVAAGVVVFAILALTPKRIKALLVLIACFCFGAVLINQNQDKSEFITDPDMPPVLVQTAESAAPSEKLVTIMIANAPSYSYLYSLEKNEAAELYKQQLMKIMFGFYAKNGFKLYPNAYVTNNNQFINAARNLNYTADEKTSFLQNQVLREGYWQFKNREDYEAYLKDNAVYDKLKEKGYKISAYQSHGIHLCNQNNKTAVNRCVSKINFPFNIDGVQMPIADKIQILLVQWLESTGWFANETVMEQVYEYVKPMFNTSKTPVVGITYRKLYVVNSFKNLDLMLSDMAQDKGAQAYFVYLDLPSDMFVYDDMCRLKPLSEWLPKYNQPWAENKNFLEKRNAYLKQTMCLFGQLEKMMQEIQKMPDGEKTTVVIEGLSGVDDMIGSNNQNLADRFRNGQMVALAIKLPGSRQFVINKSICPVEEILNNQFENGSKCTEFGRTTLSKSTKKSVKENIDAVIFTNEVAQEALQEFNHWYQEWSKINYREPVKPLLQTSSKMPVEKADNTALSTAQLAPTEEQTEELPAVNEEGIKSVAESHVENLAETDEKNGVAE